jgi:hypothetical protein
VVALSVTILLAVAGYVATYVNGLRLQERKDRLDRVNEQLRELYGPMFAISSATHMVWKQMRATLRRPEERFWGGTPPPTDAEKATWRLWMAEVFMPANERLQEVIVTRADLLREDHVPDCLLQLCAHVGSYRTLVRRWEAGDLADHLAIVEFPRELVGYAERAYLELKAEQARLLRMRSAGRPA